VLLSQCYDRRQDRLQQYSASYLAERLKPGNHDGHMGLSFDHVKHACDEYYTHASLLLTALIVHGCMKGLEFELCRIS